MTTVISFLFYCLLTLGSTPQPWNGWQMAHLKGPVSEISTNIADIKQSFGHWISMNQRPYQAKNFHGQTPLLYFIPGLVNAHYDENGNTIKKDLKPWSVAYDKLGQKVSQSTYNNAGDPIKTIIYAYNTKKQLVQLRIYQGKSNLLYSINLIWSGQQLSQAQLLDVNNKPLVNVQYQGSPVKKALITMVGTPFKMEASYTAEGLLQQALLPSGAKVSLSYKFDKKQNLQSEQVDFVRTVNKMNQEQKFEINYSQDDLYGNWQKAQVKENIAIYGEKTYRPLWSITRQLKYSPISVTPKNPPT